MSRANVDAWVVLCRENDNDPLAMHIGCENAGATAAFLFLKQGEGLRSIALSPAGEAKALQDIALHDEVVSVETGTDIFARVAAKLAEAKPKRIAVNSSRLMTVADGLSATQRERLEEALTPALRKRLVSSEELVFEWLSEKLPEEVEIMRQAAALTASLQVEAYRTVVPGKTRDSDVARFLKKRMAELGVGDGWAPEQNPQAARGLGAAAHPPRPGLRLRWLLRLEARDAGRDEDALGGGDGGGDGEGGGVPHPAAGGAHPHPLASGGAAGQHRRVSVYRGTARIWNSFGQRFPVTSSRSWAAS
ncbi:hypothetical protein [Archangium sp.]|uniref:hypothetical protein n=1 Tax=Archangium sp. TaxID=1872627 RepID=UPI00286D0A6C|nr:hypothetical protein [Archangium sp.]